MSTLFDHLPQPSKKYKSYDKHAFIQSALPPLGIAYRDLKPEEKICVEFYNFLFELLAKGSLLYSCFHVGHQIFPSSKRSVAEIRYGRKLKMMGKINGVPDYAFLSNVPGYFSFYIEVKTEKGRLSESQELFIGHSREIAKVPTYLCRSFQECVDAFYHKESAQALLFRYH